MNYNENNKMFYIKNNDKNQYIWRYENNPLINLDQTDFWHICNSAILIVNDKYIGVFRK